MKKKSILIFLFFFAIQFPSCVFGFYNHSTTGDILPKNHYRATLEGQSFFTEYSGLNIIGQLSAPIDNESEFSGILGTGQALIMTGGFYKWVPFPDIDQQPAIGAKIGFIYARLLEDSVFSARFHPFISKSFETQIGFLNSYLSLPLGVTTIGDKGSVPINLTFGVDYKTYHFKNLTFMFEIGMDIQESFSYFSLGINLTFDESKGFVIE